jgi:hypothetical protein
MLLQKSIESKWIGAEIKYENYLSEDILNMRSLVLYTSVSLLFLETSILSEIRLVVLQKDLDHRLYYEQ